MEVPAVGRCLGRTDLAVRAGWCDKCKEAKDAKRVKCEWATKRVRKRKKERDQLDAVPLIGSRERTKTEKFVPSFEPERFAAPTLDSIRNAVYQAKLKNKTSSGGVGQGESSGQAEGESIPLAPDEPLY
jgi:hypothetical protein